MSIIGGLFDDVPYVGSTYRDTSLKVLEELFQLLAKCETDEQAITELRGFAMRFMAQKVVKALRQEEEQALTRQKVGESAMEMQRWRADQQLITGAQWNANRTGLIKSK